MLLISTLTLFQLGMTDNEAVFITGADSAVGLLICSLMK